MAVSEALQDPIARLAGQLREEAETIVTEAQLQERSQTLECTRQEWDQHAVRKTTG
jgi:hypothetical protein